VREAAGRTAPEDEGNFNGGGGRSHVG